MLQAVKAVGALLRYARATADFFGSAGRDAASTAVLYENLAAGTLKESEVICFVLFSLFGKHMCS